MESNRLREDVKLVQIYSPEVQWVRPDLGVAEIAERMRSLAISCVVVCENRKPIGIITERDLTAYLARLLESGTAPAACAASLMTQPVITVSPDSSVELAVAILDEKRIRRLVVVKADGSLAGIITQTDIVRALHKESEAKHQEREQKLIDEATELTSQNDGLRLQLSERAVAEELAVRIFDQVLDSPELHDRNVKMSLSPCSILNGDVILGARRPCGDPVYLVGDFTGHGLSAALGAIPIADIFHSMVQRGFELPAILSSINNRLYDILPTAIFFAAGCFQIHRAESRLSVWVGGLPSIYVIGRQGGIKHRFSSMSLPLGIQRDTLTDVIPVSVPFESGDRLYAYTDGVIEASDLGGQLLGEKRLESIMSHTEPERLFETILEAVMEFSWEQDSQTDDISIIEVVAALELPPSKPLRSRGSGKNAHPTEWAVIHRFDGMTLRRADPVPILMRSMSDFQDFGTHQGRIHTVLAELFSNALDHGLLRLDSSIKQDADGFATYYNLRQQRLNALDPSAMIEIELAHRPAESDPSQGRLHIKVRDSGPGFNFEKVWRSLNSNDQPFGRGIPLVASLCEEIAYRGTGNEVEVFYQWK